MPEMKLVDDGLDLYSIGTCLFRICLYFDCYRVTGLQPSGS